MVWIDSGPTDHRELAWAAISFDELICIKLIVVIVTSLLVSDTVLYTSCITV